LLLDGFNDSDAHAQGVARWIHSRPRSIQHLYHINLLRYNPMNEDLFVPSASSAPSASSSTNYVKTDEANLERFAQKLQQHGIEQMTTRQSFGVDIDAACGQLFAKYEGKRMKV
jgi:23S rRNA (adenine-C8)-methyltransferase